MKTEKDFECYDIEYMLMRTVLQLANCPLRGLKLIAEGCDDGEMLGAPLHRLNKLDCSLSKHSLSWS